MTTAFNLIRRSARDLRIASPKEDPSDDVALGALILLNMLLQEAISEFTRKTAINERLSDRASNVASYRIPYNSRVSLDIEGDLELELENRSIDGGFFTLTNPYPGVSRSISVSAGGSYLFQGARSASLDSGFTAGTWLHRADLGDWVRVFDLEAEDECLFSPEHDSFVCASLSLAMAPAWSVASSDIEQFREVRDAGRSRMLAQFAQFSKKRPWDADSELPIHSGGFRARERFTERDSETSRSERFNRGFL